MRPGSATIGERAAGAREPSNHDELDPGAPSGRAVPRWLAERALPGRRLFIAVPVPAPAVEAVVALVAGVRAAVATPGLHEVRWVRLEGLHLTLRFLGPTLDERLPALREIIAEAARETSPFHLELAGAGAFPGPIRPRVLWLGVGEGGERLTTLAGTVGELLAAAGWPADERPFRPHLSLARADGIRAGTATAAALVAAAATFRQAWTVDRVTLFESHTGNGAARYEPLAEAHLGG